MSGAPGDYKIKSIGGKDSGGSAWQKYRSVMYGDQPLSRVLYAELVTLLCGSLPGAVGLLLRRALYPRLFGACGAKTVFGRNLTLRHAHKIRLGAGVIIDDNVVLDAKGGSNRGVDVGDGVYIGRNTIVYCKNGDIRLERNVNLSSNCQVYSSNVLQIGEGTVIGAYSYLLSGGSYDMHSPLPFAQQTGMETAGPLQIGANCWLGARITVLDAASIGDGAVIGAGAMVNKPVLAGVLAAGVPARVIRVIEKTKENGA